jgi:hypothetical protein
MMPDLNDALESYRTKMSRAIGRENHGHASRGCVTREGKQHLLFFVEWHSNYLARVPDSLEALLSDDVNSENIYHTT